MFEKSFLALDRLKKEGPSEDALKNLDASLMDAFMAFSVYRAEKYIKSFKSGEAFSD